MKKIVLTGAAGNLGDELRAMLAGMADELVSTDIAPLRSDALSNETYVQADLAQMDQIKPLIAGADMVVHFGAIVDELPFEQMWGPNFVGSYNVFQSAKEHGCRRVIYASSIHAMGMYPKTDPIPVDAPHRPDTWYGLAKCFTEDLGRMYWDKDGIESVHLRIYSATSKPGNARAVGSWLSFDDLRQLVRKSIDTPLVGFTIVYGISDNDRAPVDNTAGRVLGYRPTSNGEDYAEEVFAKEPPSDPQDIGQMCHGGPFASAKLGVSPMAQMGIPQKDDG